MKKYYNELGVSHTTALSRLRKELLFSFSKKLSMDTCFRCHIKIESIDEFTIDHKIPWRNSGKEFELHFDPDNVAFSHTKCNVDEPKSKRKSYEVKNTCNKGHELTPDNTYLYKNKWRQCRICMRKYSLDNYYKRKKAKEK